jgi:RNA polymerase-binding transcription factor DksA
MPGCGIPRKLTSDRKGLQYAPEFLFLCMPPSKRLAPTAVTAAPVPKAAPAAKGHKQAFLTSQLGYFRARLDELRGTKPEAPMTSGAGDRVDITSDRDTVIDHVQRLAANSTEIAAAEAAIRRIEMGTYGVCVQCRGLIPQARLKPDCLPYTVVCVKDSQ